MTKYETVQLSHEEALNIRIKEANWGWFTDNKVGEVYWNKLTGEIMWVPNCKNELVSYYKLVTEKLPNRKWKQTDKRSWVPTGFSELSKLTRLDVILCIESNERAMLRIDFLNTYITYIQYTNIDEMFIEAEKVINTIITKSYDEIQRAYPVVQKWLNQ